MVEIAVKLLVIKVTENYYPTAMVLEREERQEYLETNYNFTCACDACTGNVPTMR